MSLSHATVSLISSPSPSSIAKDPWMMQDNLTTIRSPDQPLNPIYELNSHVHRFWGGGGGRLWGPQSWTTDPGDDPSRQDTSEESW